MLSLGAVSALYAVDGAQFIVVLRRAAILIYERSLAVLETRIAPAEFDALEVGGVSECCGLAAVLAQGLRFGHFGFLAVGWPWWVSPGG